MGEAGGRLTGRSSYTDVQRDVISVGERGTAGGGGLPEEGEGRGEERGRDDEDT